MDAAGPVVGNGATGTDLSDDDGTNDVVGYSATSIGGFLAAEPDGCRSAATTTAVSVAGTTARRQLACRRRNGAWGRRGITCSQRLGWCDVTRCPGAGRITAPPLSPIVERVASAAAFHGCAHAMLSIHQVSSFLGSFY